MKFEWDPNKAALNLEKHGVTFPEATTIFDDELSVTTPDPDHSLAEQRYIIVGSSHQGRLLIVAYTERSDHIRIITARELTPKERKAYEQGDYL